PVMIRDGNNRPTGKTLEDGLTIFVRKHHNPKTKFDELVWYKDNAGVEHKAPKKGWRIFSGSYRVMQEEAVKGIPLLAKNNLETQTDTEVKLPKPIAVKAGEELGLMGEYNQADEQDKKLLHLEVFTYDNIDAFRTKAKAAYEENKKREKGKRVLQDNFLYVNRNSPTYAIAENQVMPLGTTSTEVMVPLSEVEKETVKEGEKSRDYYNIQPYLHHGTKSKTGIYVDDSHVTHGITFPGANVFSQASNSLCLFDVSLDKYINPNSGLTLEDKNQLDPMFRAIMDELDLEADKSTPIQFEAGRLRDILLDPIQQRRLTGIIVKHDNEWKTTRQLDFEPVCNVYRENGKEEKATRLAKRVDDLSIGLKVEQFDTEQQAYFIHPLGVIGALMPYSTCFCHRDFTVEEVKNIIHSLRDSEPNVKKSLGYSLFSAKNCQIPKTEATYEKLTKELNLAMRKYEINTCIRKIHFLAQCYHESGHFSTSQEFGSLEYLKNKFYYPYIGRGLIQLTHSGEKIGEIGYKQYFEYIGRSDYSTNYSLLNQDLHLAVDASGYFWKRGKLLGSGNVLKAKYPNSNGEKNNYPKTKLSTHTTVDINLVADDDNTHQVTYLVNGGQYAINERIAYVNELKRIFNYDKNHKDK
uniref:glycoside hydrolase family 19 n=1 Tax=Glaesserella sp. TaxID=2094731 RepID=UPI00359F371F